MQVDQYQIRKDLWRSISPLGNHHVIRPFTPTKHYTQSLIMFQKSSVQFFEPFFYPHPCIQTSAAVYYIAATTNRQQAALSARVLQRHVCTYASGNCRKGTNRTRLKMAGIGNRSFVGAFRSLTVVGQAIHRYLVDTANHSCSFDEICTGSNFDWGGILQKKDAGGTTCC